jgi:hypothetical protein
MNRVQLDPVGRVEITILTEEVTTRCWSIQRARESWSSAGR